MSVLDLDGNFESRKDRILKELQYDSATSSPDKSPKGFVDEPIIPLIGCINESKSFYTTSSCSGRISLFLQESFDENKDNDEHHTITKKGGEWLLISHGLIDNDQITKKIYNYKQKKNNKNPNKQIEISLKFEPFILHIECKDLLSAKELLSLSRQHGFRESGINAISNRVILRVTFNLRLDVPLFYGPLRLLLSQKKHVKNDYIIPNINENYVKMLTNIANDKMKENLEKINLFYNAFKSKFVPSFKWYTSYKNQPHLLASKVSDKMDDLHEKINLLKRSIQKIQNSLMKENIPLKLPISSLKV